MGGVATCSALGGVWGGEQLVACTVGGGGAATACVEPGGGSVGWGQRTARRVGWGVDNLQRTGRGSGGDTWRRAGRGWGGVGTTCGSPIEIDSRVMPFHGMSVAVQLQMTHATWGGAIFCTFICECNANVLHASNFFSRAQANGMINKGPW